MEIAQNPSIENSPPAEFLNENQNLFQDEFLVYEHPGFSQVNVSQLYIIMEFSFLKSQLMENKIV